MLTQTVQPTPKEVEERSHTVYERSNLTKLQLLYWVGQKFRPTSPLFNTILVFTFPVQLDAEIFAKAFQLIVQSSDVLRTVVQEVEGVPQRQVLPQLVHQMEWLDFSQESQPEETLKQWLAQRSVMVLDIETCLFDTALIKVSPTRYEWYLNQHHLITDAASSFLVFRYVIEVYERLCQGKPVEVLPLGSFEEYAVFERSFTASTRYPKAKAYWEERLAQKVEPMRFFGRFAFKKSSRVQRISYHLDTTRTQQLRLAATKYNTTTLTPQLAISNLLTGLFFAHLHCLSGNFRLISMIPFHNRPTKTLKGTIGLLMEFCPLPVDLTPQETFVSLLQKVSREMQRVLLHYQYGSEIVLQNPVSEVMFNFHHREALQFQGQRVSQQLVHPQHGGDTFALHVHDLEDSGEFLLNFDFHEDVFSLEERHQAIELFLQLLDAFLTNPEQPLSALRTVTNLTGKQEFTNGAIQPDRSLVSPAIALELQLRQIWEEALEIKPISIHDNFFDLGGSSWQALRVFTQIEKLTGTYLPLAALFEAGTIAKLAQLLQEQAGVDRWASMVTIQGRGEKRPFFCVHGAGGHVLAFTKLARFLKTDRPFYAFQAQGLDGKRPLLTSVPQMAAYYLQEMQKIQPHGPYLLGGYSMGGVVAFEMAQQLAHQGEQVAFLAIIDTPAQLPALKTAYRVIHQIGRFLSLSPHKQEELFLYLRRLSLRLRHRARTGWRANLQIVWQKVGRSKSTTASITPAFINHEPIDDEDQQLRQANDERIRRMYLVNHRALELYNPEPYPGAITLFKSTQGYGDIYKDDPHPHMGWGRIAKGGVETCLIPGTHHAIMIGANVQLLAEELQAQLDKFE